MKFCRNFLSACLLLAWIPVPAQDTNSGDLPTAPTAQVIPALILHPGNGVTSPKLVYSVVPEYTAEARRDRIRGTCTLSVLVTAKGTVKSAIVTRSVAEGQPFKLRASAATLDEKAVEAVLQYRFRPALLKGKPVVITVPIQVNFEIF